MRKAHLLIKSQKITRRRSPTTTKLRPTALDIVLIKRTSCCRSCQVQFKKADAQGFGVQARVGADETRSVRQAWRLPKAGVPGKGMASWICMSADHVDPNTKVHCLSDYKWWSCNGDVESMRTELDKCQWICICCHFLEPTSSTGRQRRSHASERRAHSREASVRRRA